MPRRWLFKSPSWLSFVMSLFLILMQAIAKIFSYPTVFTFFVLSAAHHIDMLRLMVTWKPIFIKGIKWKKYLCISLG